MKGFRLWLGALCALTLAACGGGGPKSPDFTPVLKTITVTPNGATIGVGETLSFNATGVFTSQPGVSDRTEVITTEVKWTSTHPEYVTIDETTGVATGVAEGTTEIVASRDGVEGRVLLNNAGIILREVVVTLDSPGVAPGGSTNATAQGIYSNSPTPRDITDAVINWSFDGPALGTIAPATGKTVKITAGSTTGLTNIKACVGTSTKCGTAQFGVGQLSGLQITPATDTKPVGRRADFKAQGIYSLQTGSSQTFTIDVPATWQAENDTATSPANSLPPSLVNDCVGGSSAITCGVVGNTAGAKVKITARYEGQTSNVATLNVTAADLFAIAIALDPPGTDNQRIAGSTLSLGLKAAQTLYPVYYYSDSQTVPESTPRFASDKISWTTQAAANVSLANNTDGSATIKGEVQGTSSLVQAKSGSLTRDLTVSVTGATIQSLEEIRPAKGFVAVNKKIRFRAFGKLSTGEIAEIPDGASGDVTWSSDNTAIATFADANIGEATAGSAQSPGITIRAKLKSNPAQEKTATLVVTTNVCTIPLEAADGAIASEGDAAGVCLLCGVGGNPLTGVLTGGPYPVSNVTDPNRLNFSTINVTVGLLDAYRSIRVMASPTAGYRDSDDAVFKAGRRPAFVIARPRGALLKAEVLDQVQIETIGRDGAVKESSASSPTRNLLRVDLLGIELLDLPGTPDQELTLVSMPTTLPYDGMQLKLKSGTATALSDVLVFSACGTSSPLSPAPSGISRLEAVNGAPNDEVPQIEVGASLGFVAYDFASPTQQISSEDVTWTATGTGGAAADVVSETGVVQSNAAGNYRITATLKDKSLCAPDGPGPGPCSASRDVTIVPPAVACDTPLTAATGATVKGQASGGLLGLPLCILCTGRDLPNVIDGVSATYGSALLPVAALGSSYTVTVTGNTAQPFEAGKSAGFVVRSPAGKVLTLDLLQSVVVRTLRNGIPTGDSSDNLVTPLRLDLLQIPLIEYSGAQRMYVKSTRPYDSVQITFNSGVAQALSQYDIYAACGATQ